MNRNHCEVDTDSLWSNFGFGLKRPLIENRKRAAAIISSIQSARLNGHDPYAYLKGVLMRLQTQKNPDRRPAAASLAACCVS